MCKYGYHLRFLLICRDFRRILKENRSLLLALEIHFHLPRHGGHMSVSLPLKSTKNPLESISPCFTSGKVCLVAYKRSRTKYRTQTSHFRPKNTFSGVRLPINRRK